MVGGFVGKVDDIVEALAEEGKSNGGVGPRNP
jgi:hypothetical protein